MLWLELTAERFPDAIEESDGLCLLPIGSIERHGPHLPIGCDTLTVEAVTKRAAEVEPAVVFPPLYFGQIAEARHCAGTISLDHDLLLELVRATLDEIARNGFDKILIVNGHGGNNGLLSYLMFYLLQEPRDYVPYVSGPGVFEEDAEKWAEMREVADGHAGVGETSIMMHVCPDAVHLEDFTDPADAAYRGWQKDLGGIQNPMSWYAEHPTHISGDPRPATAEKGEFLVEAAVRKLVDTIKRVKADEVTPGLMEEFYRKAERPAGTDG